MGLNKDYLKKLVNADKDKDKSAQDRADIVSTEHHEANQSEREVQTHPLEDSQN